MQEIVSFDQLLFKFCYLGKQLRKKWTNPLRKMASLLLNSMYNAKVTKQEWSDFYVVFTVILCGCNFGVS